MNRVLHTSLALVCVLALTSCKKGQQTSPQPPAPVQPAKTPTKAPDTPPAKASPATGRTAAGPPSPITAAELTALLDKATRIEAKSGKLQKPPWSKDLTKADIANLKAGIGQPTDIHGSIPRCLPTVLVTLYQQEKELATLGAFCSRGKPTGPIRFEIGKNIGSFTPADIAKVAAVLESPVDK